MPIPLRPLRPLLLALLAGCSIGMPQARAPPQRPATHDSTGLAPARNDPPPPPPKPLPPAGRDSRLFACFCPACPSWLYLCQSPLPPLSLVSALLHSASHLITEDTLFHSIPCFTLLRLLSNYLTCPILIFIFSALPNHTRYLSTAHFLPILRSSPPSPLYQRMDSGCVCVE